MNISFNFTLHPNSHYDLQEACGYEISAVEITNSGHLNVIDKNGNKRSPEFWGYLFFERVGGQLYRTYFDHSQLESFEKMEI